MYNTTSNNNLTTILQYHHSLYLLKQDGNLNLKTVVRCGIEVYYWNNHKTDKKTINARFVIKTTHTENMIAWKLWGEGVENVHVLSE